MAKLVIGENKTRLIPIMLDSIGHFVPSRMTKGGVGNDSKLDIILAGENASVEVVGLVLGKSNENKSFEIYITHAAPKTKSEVKVRSVLKGRSIFSFRGNVKIEKGAKGADAYLRSDALLFDEAKMGDDTPALEILEPDVKAGHAATVGKVDEAMLFYLMSRGLTRVMAEKLLIDGFTKPILERIKGRPSFAIPALEGKKVVDRRICGASKD